MEAYTGFAAVYDRFMDNVPYEEWAGYLWELLKEYGVEDGLVLDLGCGTGNLTEALAGRGYDMIGVDNAEDMLQIAMEKREKSGSDILYLLQDMREFELYGTVAAVVSICDSMNYLTEYEELVHTLSLVNNYLDPEGIFIFDLNTLHKYRDVIGDSTIAESREDCCFIWDNVFDEEERINEYDLTLFIEVEGGLYQRFEETHYQKAYTLEEIRQAVAEAGMKLEAVYDAFTREEPKEDSERVYVVVRERGKARR
ncbi:MAG: class I SAM-dependent methyltransferase [Hungatella sp.]|nr:class I SAM-dependent methyltransferase [Hungatella sp.]